VTGTVHVVVPATIDDPARPSGGNVYDRRLVAELGAGGWIVHQHALAGSWPHPSRGEEGALGDLLESLTGTVVLVDGLIASAAPALVSRYADRAHLVVLVHQPLGLVSPELRRSEGAMLRRVGGVVVTSAWTQAWLAEHEGVPGLRVQVAVPGAYPADAAPGTASGGALVCIGALTHEKGHDVLLQALEDLASLPWTCTCIGSLEVDPAFARDIVARGADLGDRVEFTGALDRDEVEAAYRSADVLVLPSRAETYGMVVSEALAHGLPVIASAVGGVPEALGTGPGGVVPGMLVPTDDAALLSGALRAWLTEPPLRARARTAARDRRLRLPRWADTAAHVARVLAPVSQPLL
jgi:glycosyltransferase involved in cell wall biosynthesis